MPQGRGIFYGLTVTEHFRLDGLRDSAELDAAFAHFPALRDLGGRRAGLLSGGEQQMLAIARALSRRPRLLLVDELSLGLAPVIVERLLPVVREFASSYGTAVLLVEQHVHLALEIADRGYVLSHGELVASDSAERLRADSALLAASYLGERQRLSLGGAVPGEHLLNPAKAPATLERGQDSVPPRWAVPSGADLRAAARAGRTAMPRSGRRS